MFIIAYAFKGQVHAFAGQIKNCKSLVLQDKFNIEIFLSPVKCVVIMSSVPTHFFYWGYMYPQVVQFEVYVHF